MSLTTTMLAVSLAVNLTAPCAVPEVIAHHRRIVFVGDSNMRNLFYLFLHRAALGNIGPNTDPKAHFIAVECPSSTNTESSAAPAGCQRTFHPKETWSRDSRLLLAFVWSTHLPYALRLEPDVLVVSPGGHFVRTNDPAQPQVATDRLDAFVADFQSIKVPFVFVQTTQTNTHDAVWGAVNAVRNTAISRINSLCHDHPQAICNIDTSAAGSDDFPFYDGAHFRMPYYRAVLAVVLKCVC